MVISDRFARTIGVSQRVAQLPNRGGVVRLGGNDRLQGRDGFIELRGVNVVVGDAQIGARVIGFELQRARKSVERARVATIRKRFAPTRPKCRVAVFHARSAVKKRFGQRVIARVSGDLRVLVKRIEVARRARQNVIVDAQRLAVSLGKGQRVGQTAQRFSVIGRCHQVIAKRLRGLSEIALNQQRGGHTGRRVRVGRIDPVSLTVEFQRALGLSRRQRLGRAIDQRIRFGRVDFGNPNRARRGRRKLNRRQLAARSGRRSRPLRGRHRKRGARTLILGQGQAGRDYGQHRGARSQGAATFVPRGKKKGES